MPLHRARPASDDERRRFVFRPQPQIVGTRAGDTLVLLDLRRGRYYTLNEAGAVAWDAIADGASAPAIVERVQRAFDAPAPEIEADIERLLHLLIASELITQVAP